MQLYVLPVSSTLFNFFFSNVVRLQPLLLVYAVNEHVIKIFIINIFIVNVLLVIQKFLHKVVWEFYRLRFCINFWENHVLSFFKPILQGRFPNSLQNHKNARKLYSEF